jgi:hypothetical protein
MAFIDAFPEGLERILLAVSQGPHGGRSVEFHHGLKISTGFRTHLDRPLRRSQASVAREEDRQDRTAPSRNRGEDIGRLPRADATIGIEGERSERRPSLLQPPIRPPLASGPVGGK